MVASPDRALLTGSRSILASPGDENGMPSPSSTGRTYTSIALFTTTLPSPVPDSFISTSLCEDETVPSPPTITPVLVADLLVEGERWPVYVHVIDHPDARVLVDTGMTELHPAVADLDPRLVPLSEQAFDVAGVDVVVNTHLHFDHCGGNRLFAGRPIHVQRQELEDARSQDDYTIRDWVDAPGVRYEPVDGELELLPGLRLVPAPGHTRGMQMVVIETGARPVIVGGDVAVWFGELDEPRTEGQLLVRALEPELVWLAHEHEPWRPARAPRVVATDPGS